VSGDGAGELVVCLSTAPDADAAERIARALVEERLIACANLLPGVVSLYRWEGEVQREPEVMMLIKTRRSLVRRLEERFAELHPYEVPELLVVGVEDGLPAYCRWVLEQT
jgi:periplasmic divalent cation tolerance protein